MNEIVEHQNYSEFSRKILLPGATSEEVVSILEFSYEYITTLRQEIIQNYWIDTYVNLLRESSWKSKSLLSFEDFYEFPWVRNNIQCFFYDNYVWEVYRSQGFYKKFASENPELDQRLKELYNRKRIIYKKSEKDKLELGNSLNYDNRTNVYKKYHAHIKMILLYQAYKIMHWYNEVKTNHDLFV